MSMFDWYRPSGELHCPVCNTPLAEWQGKDSVCGLFIWQEGLKHPVNQAISDPDIRIDPVDYDGFTLPPEFVIYSYDCPDHEPILAYCTTNEQQTWTETLIMPYTLEPFDRHSLWFTQWLKETRDNSPTPNP